MSIVWWKERAGLDDDAVGSRIVLAYPELLSVPVSELDKLWAELAAVEFAPADAAALLRECPMLASAEMADLRPLLATIHASRIDMYVLSGSYAV